MIRKSKIFNITPVIVRDSGILHKIMKKENKRFGLADSLMITKAKSLSANLLTADTI